MQANLENKSFRNVYVLESRNFWNVCQNNFDKSQDLVLTYDLGLKKTIEAIGGNVLFLDHLVSPTEMQKNNFLIYNFLNRWFLDKKGIDLFVFKGVSFGPTFMLDVWNDFTFHLRIRICLEHFVQSVSCKRFFIGEEKDIVSGVLQEMNVAFQSVDVCDERMPVYCFPIFRYMHEKTRSFSFKSQMKDLFMLVQGSVLPRLSKLFIWQKGKPKVFIQEYHPTREILRKLRDEEGIQVIVERISATPGLLKYVKEWAIPMWGKEEKFKAEAKRIMGGYQAQRNGKLILNKGLDVSVWIYRIIDQKVKQELPNQLRLLDNIIGYTDNVNIDLEVLIANIGRTTSLLDCVLKNKGISSYLIINGLLGPEYSNESKYASIINGYSESIKSFYFKGQKNVICLGDPRMDAYAPVKPRKFKFTEVPTITIGASGFNPVDLNSYVGVEFDFLYDVLFALQELRNKGFQSKVVIKVRPNGYQKQYESFVKEYYPDLVNSIVSTVPMRQVLENTDFYISIYSQTLFEASCLGVPVVYYKKDTEIMGPPFDGDSELVTVNNIDALESVIMDFYHGHERFDAFLEQSTMEKYVGSLDGGNTQRNISQIKRMLND